MMPNRSEVLQKAKELFFQDAFRNGITDSTTPEDSELLESGFYDEALSELLRNVETKNAEWLNQNENFDKIETVTDSKTIFDIKEALDTGFVISGAKQCGKTTLAKNFVKQLMNAQVTVYVFDTSQAWNHNSPINSVTEISTEEENYFWTNSQILDLSQLGIRERTIFVNQCCKNIFQDHVNGYNQQEFIVLEEAHSYLPNGSMRLSVRKKNVLDGVLDLMTVGANYKIGFGLITQFPAMVDKTPIKACLQRYFGWTWEKNDVNYIKGFLPKEWSEKLRDLQRGQFIRQCRNDIRIVENEKPFNEAKHETVYSFKTRVICA
jgi:hypothetical protein